MQEKNLRNDSLRRRVRRLLQQLRELEERRMNPKIKEEIKARIWIEIQECFDFWDWEDPG